MRMTCGAFAGDTGRHELISVLFMTTALTGTGCLAGAALALAVTAGAAKADDWTGAVSSDWFTDGNWDDGSVPVSVNSAVIDTATPAVIDSPGAVGAGLLVGNAAAGSLIIRDGGTFTSAAQNYIGTDTAAIGTVTVTDPGSLWLQDDTLYVGFRGNGTLTIDQGGVVRNHATWLGNYAGSAGTLHLNGTSGARGVLETNAIYNSSGAASVVFDGGILRARSNQPSMISSGSGTIPVTINGGGAYIDTNGWDIGFQSPLSGPGELVKQGDGKLILSTPNTHGSTRVSEGTLIVYGATASITHATGDMIVGDQAGVSAGLRIHGGPVENGNGYVGQTSGSIGEVTVTGSGATWTNSGVVEVGFNGTGTLTVENGGLVTGTFGYVGALSGSHGTATVTGANSKWTSSESLAVGHTGIGSLTIGAGGTVENTYAYIGYNLASAPSTVTVTGTDSTTGTASTWKNSGNLYVGGGGSGVLTIAAGGAVTASSGLLGLNTGSQGTATVTGAGSTWSNSASMTVGLQGAGSLTIADGGAVTNTHGTLGASAGSHGTAIVTGLGSKWTNTGNLTVGHVGVGSLFIEDHGTVTNTDGYIGYEAAGAPSTVTVDGEGSTWTNSGSISLGWHGAGSLTVSGGGDVKSVAAFIGHSTGESEVTVTGAGSRWDASGSMLVGFGGKGTLTVADGASVSSLGIHVAENAGSEGTVNIGAAAGDAAVAAGTLDTPQVTFGDGDGALVFNHTQTATNYLFAPRIVGSGQINLLAGTTELNDAGGFSGATSVKSGATLVANGTLGGTLDVLAGGLLKGSGTVGSVNIAGTIAPGNSIGTLSTAGPLAFTSGSIYEVEVNDTGGSDRIAVTGGVTIDPGATVTVLPENGTDDGSTYAPETSYTILTATTGRTGMFDPTVSEGFAFLDAALSYDPNSVFLKLSRNAITFPSLGETPNQRATAGAVEAMGAGTTLYDTVVTLTEPEALTAFDALSGEVHASAKSVLIEDSRFVREAVDARLRAAFAGVGANAMPVLAYGDEGPKAAPADTDRFAAWGHAFGSWGEWDGDGNAASLTRDTGGFVLGGDMAVADIWRLGLLAGYSHSSFDIDDRASSGSADSYHLGAYAGTKIGRIGLRFGGAYSWHAIETARTASFPGFTDSLEADYDAATAQLFGEAGYRIDTAHVSFEPFANLVYVNLHTDGFTESGGAAALTASSSSQDTTFTTLGLRAGTTLPLGNMTARLHGMLGWRHAFGDIPPTADLAFAGGGAFAIAGVPIAEDAAVIEAGLDLALSPNANLGIAYNGQIGDGTSDHGAKARFGMTF